MKKFDRLIDYICVFASNPHDTAQIVSELYIPAVQHSDLPLPAKIEWFAIIPEEKYLSLIENRKKTFTHTFIHAPKSAKIFGFCINILSEKQIYSLCILSRLPIVNIIDPVFNFLQMHSFSDFDEFQTKTKECFLNYTNFPMLPAPLFSLSFSPTFSKTACNLAFYQQGTFPNLAANNSYHILFKKFSLHNIITLFSFLLLENKIVLVSSDMSKLAIIGDALLSLIYPFKWQHIFIPYLPKYLYDLLDAPVPFLLGVQGGNNEIHELRGRGFVVIDVDSGSVYTEAGSTLEMPKIQQNRLFLVVSGLLREEISEENWKEKISIAFCSGVVSLLLGYRDFLVLFKSISNSFDVNSFLETKQENKAEYEFIESLVKTNLFEVFIAEQGSLQMKLFDFVYKIEQDFLSKQLISFTSNAMKSKEKRKFSNGGTYIQSLTAEEAIHNEKERLNARIYPWKELFRGSALLRVKSIRTVIWEEYSVEESFVFFCEKHKIPGKVVEKSIENLKSFVGTKKFDSKRKGSFDPDVDSLTSIIQARGSLSPRKSSRNSFNKRIKAVQHRPSLLEINGEEPLKKKLSYAISRLFSGESNSLSFFSEQDLESTFLLSQGLRDHLAILLHEAKFENKAFGISESVFCDLETLLRSCLNACFKVNDLKTASEIVILSQRCYKKMELKKSTSSDVATKDRRRGSSLVEFGFKQSQLKRKLRQEKLMASFCELEIFDQLKFWQYFLMFKLKAKFGNSLPEDIIFVNTTEVLNTMTELRVETYLSTALLQSLRIKRGITEEEEIVLKNLTTNLQAIQLPSP
eukprot:snap_masked-scaffold_30-processed-gene-1.16-mRNA-1 protein AED:0.46 eAED:0.46 QI:0/-1/0/1/-1/1/1/0/802